MDLNISLSYLCNYILRYSKTNYTDLTPAALSRIKVGIHKDSYNKIVEILQSSDLEDKDVICKNLVKIFMYFYKRCDKDKIDNDSFEMILDLLRGSCIGGVSINEEERQILSDIKNQLLSKFKETFKDDALLNGIVNDTLIMNDNDAHRQMIQHPPQASSTQVSGLSAPIHNQSNNSQSIIDYLNQFKTEFNNFKLEVKNSIKSINQSTNDINSITDPEIKLTSSKIKEIRTTIYRIYDKMIRMDHHKNLFKTHRDNKTVPSMMSYSRYPVPFLWDDQIFIDAYNTSIREHQLITINIIIDRLESIKKSLEEDLLALKDSLKSYKGNLDLFFDNIKASAQIDLKPFIDSGNQKLLRLNANLLEDHIINEYELNDNISNEHYNNYLILHNNEIAQYQTKENINYTKSSDYNKESNKRQYNFNTSNKKYKTSRYSNTNNGNGNNISNDNNGLNNNNNTNNNHIINNNNNHRNINNNNHNFNKIINNKPINNNKIANGNNTNGTTVNYNNNKNNIQKSHTPNSNNNILPNHSNNQQ